MKSLLLLLFLGSMMIITSTFKEEQLKHARVKKAFAEKETVVKKWFEEKGVDLNKCDIFLRAFKKDRELQLWGKNKTDDKYQLIHVFPFAGYSGSMGPKRKQGDLQIPEGTYYIDRFNPWSNFHLSLGINYPNKSDKIRSSYSKKGGDIFIHGSSVTVGCIPITDSKIQELYIAAVNAKSSGQSKIPVYIFPFNFDKVEEEDYTELAYDEESVVLWRELNKINCAFEEHRVLKKVRIDDRGRYSL